MKRAEDGQITVFVSMIMMCLFALFCLLLESARTAGAQLYLQTAASSAMDSVFSQYHRKLWDSYRLLFAEYDRNEDITDAFGGFVLPYLEMENWYPIEYSGSEAEEIIRATEGQGIYLEEEILDYMKFGIWKPDFDMNTASELWNSGKQAAFVKKTAEHYRGHAREALRLEKALEAISENLSKQRQFKAEGLAALRGYDGSGFRREAKNLISQLKKIPGLVKNYKKRADTLAEGLKESRAEYESGSGDCDKELLEILEQEIKEYEDYVAVDGNRRMEIEALEPAAKQMTGEIEGLIEESYDVEEEIEDWDDEEDEDGPDLEALWFPVEHRFGKLEIPALSFSHGIKDKKKEGFLEQVLNMYQEGFLGLVVPENREISKKAAVLEELPSHKDMDSSGNRTISFVDHILVDEYCGEHFKNFMEESETEAAESSAGENSQEGSVREVGEENSAEKIPETVFDYEIEYMLGGKESDRENLSETIQKLLAIREGLNMAHILTDSGKRAEARNLAMAITGAGSVTPLLMVTTFLVMSVWALGESFVDVRGLFEGKKVPLLKSGEDWQLGLEDLLRMGEKQRVDTGGLENGFGYLSWLKILLFMSDISQQEFRIMDLIQLNMMQDQKSFRMNRCVYQIRIRSDFCGKHLFFTPAFVEKIVNGGELLYPMTVLTERRY